MESDGLILVCDMLDFNGQRWIVDECSLSVALPLHSQNLPEVWWSLEVGAHPHNTQNHHDLRISVQPLFAPLRDWRELENLEVNVDPAWQDAHEFVNVDGEVQWTEIEARCWPDKSINKANYWFGDEFLLRFGSLEQGRLICELEGLLETEQDYYRDPPKISSDTSCPNGPSEKLLLMDLVQVRKCEIEVPGDVREPLAWAKAKVARALGFRAFRSSHVRSVGGTEEDPFRTRNVSLVPDFD